MATKMELVLSPGNLGGDGPDGGPFRNEDVREWSRVDRITGMLERARVETGRWRADTQDAKQSYGKMIDSRERNSADGSLVQKARRQVEIFQSQENSGRSFQVVRASQWSSSRATDCGFDIPISDKPSNTHFDDGLSNGSASLLSPRLNLWRSSLSNGASNLDQLSCLCRKLHNEALNTTNQLWSLRNAALRSPSPLSPLEAPSSASFQEIEAGLEPNLDDRLSSSSFGERRSNSTEDVSSLLNPDDAFARDCKTRRSLQIANSENGRVNYSQSAAGEAERGRRARQEFIAERARRFEEGVRRANEGTPRKNFISTKSFTPIANNDFVRNDPKHPSKFNQLAKISIQDNGEYSNYNAIVTEKTAACALAAIIRRNTHPSAVIAGIPGQNGQTRKANNKTVVHLTNVASPNCINVTAIKLQKVQKDSEQAANNENGLYGMLMDTSSAPKEEIATQVINGSKPVKKVEFCKTEIHFAADSGKVNIVETDGKPPPTNKFRRRKRKDALGAANGNAQKSNMPLVHFGDTSYEKYIFGGQGKPPQEMSNETALLGENTAIDKPANKYDPADLELKRERWNSPEKIRENGVGREDAGLENGGKHRGTHTTTVNFLSDESSAVAVPKVVEGRSSQRGISLQFAASNRGLSPISCGDEDDNEPTTVVSRTTKITVHLPPVISQHPGVLQLGNCNPFSNLKSVRLVMKLGQMTGGRDLGPAGSLSLKELFSTLYSDGEQDGLTLNESQMWSLRLKSDGESDENGDEGERILDESRMITGTLNIGLANDQMTSRYLFYIDKSGNPFPAAANQLVHKEIGSLSKRSAPKQQSLPEDPDKKQVLLKIVTTHKPMLARVENDRGPNNSLHRARPKGLDPQEESQPPAEQEEQRRGSPSVLASTDLETKDHCDNGNGVDESDCDEAPTYENIFEAVSNGDPVYENFQVLAAPIDKVAVLKKRPPSSQSEKSLANSYDRRRKKLSSKLSNGSNAEESSEKARLTRTERAKSDKNSLRSVSEDRSKSSSRSSGSRDNSIKRYKDTQAKRKNSPKVGSVAQERKGTLVISAEKNDGSIRSKKPVEVVYQTAVFNMKNEKLSKPSKGKEIKGPRLINDLICGSKLRRPSDSKRAIKSACSYSICSYSHLFTQTLILNESSIIFAAAIVSQNTSKTKEAPTTMNRYALHRNIACRSLQAGVTKYCFH
ncbi:hypothetical protein TSAR_007270 [Trichomalopsis sarcophagae]|uniref:Uncharacterized protein n=1 Tax=Trichomalopsis sarcophagae TaxID=543379 RepID=A0A232EZK7_9HYME|nr:hypothetical protein TSAR_007270 [Trichomalopsis sarcophagae]